jgi:hypothetical protein
MNYDFDDVGGTITYDLNYEEIHNLIQSKRQVIHLYKDYFIVNSCDIFRVSFRDMLSYLDNEYSLNDLLYKNEYFYNYHEKYSAIRKKPIINERGQKNLSFSDVDSFFKNGVKHNHFTEKYIIYMRNYVLKNLRQEKIKKLLNGKN